MMKSLLVAVVSTILGSAFAGNTYYLVPEGTPGNLPKSPYDSWENAANELADITDILPECNSAADGAVINVAPGTYYPTRSAVIGASRKYTTIQSCDRTTGEIDMEGTVFDGSRLSDAGGTQPRMLTTGLYTAYFRLKGLTFCHAMGGAVNVGAGSSPTVESCIFRDNSVVGANGSALLSSYNTTHVSNCIFSCNTTHRAYGRGALCTYGGTVIGCTFVSNVVDGVKGDEGMGGAIAVGDADFGGSLVIRDSSFRDCAVTNASSTSGGHIAVLGKESARVAVSNCTFSGFSCGAYGSVIRMQAVQVNLTDCRFENVSTPWGNGYGAVCLTRCVQPEILRCSFVGCSNTPLFAERDAALTVRNCLFVDPADSSVAKAIWDYGSVIGCENCTFVGFTNPHTFADLAGEQMSYVNCILPSRGQCGVKTTLSSVYVLTEEADPFIADVFGDYRLAVGSKCVDAGEELDWHAESVDLGLRARVVGAAVDIGCYERQVNDPTRHYFRAVQSEAEKTGSWKDAYVGIQAAIDAAPSGAYVGIRSGEWKIARTISVYGKSLTIQGLNAVTDEVDRDGTILDGGNERRIMQVTNREKPVFDYGATDAAIVGYSMAVVTVEGLTFRNGDATKGTHPDGNLVLDADGHRVDNNGGGLWLSGCPTSGGSLVSSYSRALNCKFVGNTAKAGGGMYLAWGGVAEDCVFEENAASGGSGGGLCGYDWHGGAVADGRASAGFTDPAAIRCQFSRNTSTRYGGGFGDGSGYGFYRIFAFDCQFDSNVSQQSGGNFSGGGGSVVGGCTFVNGRCGNQGSAANLFSSYATLITNCTFVGGNAISGVGAYALGLGGLADDGSTHAGNITIVDTVISNASYGVQSDGNLLVRNSLFANMVQLEAKVHLADGVRGEIGFENCTFAKTSIAFSEKPEMNLRLTAVNSIFDGSVTGFGRADAGHARVLEARNCCFKALPTGTEVTVDPQTCFVASPRFTAAEKGDYSIRRSSPCRDKGEMLPWMTDATDVVGNPRVMTDGKTLAENPQAKPDIGSFECPLAPKGLAVLVR